MVKDILFPLALGFLECFGELNVNLLIWTTSPWSLVLNEAFILAPDSQYVLIGI